MFDIRFCRSASASLPGYREICANLVCVDCGSESAGGYLQLPATVFLQILDLTLVIDVKHGDPHQTSITVMIITVIDHVICNQRVEIEYMSGFDRNKSIFSKRPSLCWLKIDITDLEALHA